ncbi:MAG: hypothetical protein P4L92_20350 [Rudaea sp.]|nr:hypothetical protein [Rudaea sp.]
MNMIDIYQTKRRDTFVAVAANMAVPEAATKQYGPIKKFKTVDVESPRGAPIAMDVPTVMKDIQAQGFAVLGAKVEFTETVVPKKKH